MLRLSRQLKAAQFRGQRQGGRLSLQGRYLDPVVEDASLATLYGTHCRKSALFPFPTRQAFALCG